MGSRRSPSGPRSSVTGFVVLAQTVIAPGSAGNMGSATGILQQFVGPRGTAATRMDPRGLSTNDVVSASPRGSAQLGTTQIGFSCARIASVGSASAIVELFFSNPSNAASATLIANTWNLNIALQSADL